VHDSGAARTNALFFNEWPVTESGLSEELPNGDASVPAWYWHPSLLFPAPSVHTGAAPRRFVELSPTIRCESDDRCHQLPFNAGFDFVVGSARCAFEPDCCFVKQLKPKLGAAIEYFGSFGPIGAIVPSP
jgi:hypothetical protein